MQSHLAIQGTCRQGASEVTGSHGEVNARNQLIGKRTMDVVAQRDLRLEEQKLKISLL